ncbi:MAG: hypothetical protein SFT93_06200, partial [Rickettsiaceae bacterium]|nr:hypothetical protein [Rickettsiaceae bacterium]
MFSRKGSGYIKYMLSSCSTAAMILYGPTAAPANYTITAVDNISLGGNNIGNIDYSGSGKFNILTYTNTGSVNFKGIAGTFSLTSGTLTGTVDSTVSSNGIISFGGNGSITGDIGSSNAVSALNFTGTYTADLGGANITISQINANADNTGTVKLSNAGGMSFTGTAGAPATRLNTFQWTTGKVLTLSNAAIYASTLNGIGAGSTITIAGDTTLQGSIGTNAVTTINNGTKLTLYGTTTYTPTINAAN